MDRRKFLTRSLSSGAGLGLLSACGSDNGPVSSPTAALPTMPAEVPTAPTNSAMETLADALPFQHGVVSGDPLADSVIVWTAITPANANVQAIPVRLQYVQSAQRLKTQAQWEALFNDPGQVVTVGEFQALKTRDWCVKVDLGNLNAHPGLRLPMKTLGDGRFVYYRFQVGSKNSQVARTRLLPLAGLKRARFAMASCASFPHGWFTVYHQIAREEDLDFVVHLGDYIYEYADNGNGVPDERYPGNVGSPTSALPLPVDPLGGPEPDEYGGGIMGRGAAEPAKETTDSRPQSVPASSPGRFYSSDYVFRHAQYKRDPELQRLHLNHPLIAVWDDHEFADNAWRDGANNHTEGAEGTWRNRRLKAIRAYMNWMPIREQQARDANDLPPYEATIYRNFEVGGLLNLLMLDTRIIGRDKQVSNMVDPERNRADRSLLGGAQREWLYQNLLQSKSKWTFLGQQIMMGQLDLLAVQKLQLASQSVLGELVVFNTDQWDGYTAERSRLFDVLSATRKENIVVLTGDIHTSWALELVRNPGALTSGVFEKPLGVELVTPSVTSPGFPDGVAQVVSAVLPVMNPHIKYTELKSHGFVIVDVTEERMLAQWRYVRNVTDSTLRASDQALDPALTKTLRVKSGTNQFETVAQSEFPGARP